MFIGHFAVAFAAKRLAPQISLGTLFVAAQFADLLWPTLLLLGWEAVRIAPGTTTVTPLDFVRYPISHSLAANLGWALLLAGIHYVHRRSADAAALIGALVVSHWLLDLLSHRADLPPYPGSSLKVGLGLWNSLPATLLVEGMLFAGGVLLYARRTSARDRVGTLGLWLLVALLLALYIGNIFGPPPPSPEAISWAGHATWLLVLAGYWIDRHRSSPPPGRGRRGGGWGSVGGANPSLPCPSPWRVGMEALRISDGDIACRAKHLPPATGPIASAPIPLYYDPFGDRQRQGCLFLFWGWGNERFLDVHVQSPACHLRAGQRRLAV